jgi:hypothetical protein
MLTSRSIPAIALLFLGCASAPSGESDRMNFFLTSEGPGMGAALGGIAGADRHCALLAERAGASGLTWHAYLSATATDGVPAINARDRIGNGPWYNYRHVLVARTLDELHGASSPMSKATSITERGDTVLGRGDTPNRHDILTGSQADGRAYPPGDDNTCSNWTSSTTGGARVGHHDRQGGGDAPTSWNSAHRSNGCSQQNLQATGGNGLFYCFGVR